VSRVLAARGARVLLACRDKAKAEAAMARIRQATPRADLAFLPLDQADLTSVRNAADLAASEPHIDGLINNAGAMVPTRRRTAQGFELNFGANHLGSFALTALLLPKLKEGRGSRVVLTSSGLHKDAKIDWDDLNAEKSFSGIPRYAASKLANLLFVFELDGRLRAVGVPITVAACHPGLAATGIGSETVLSRVVMPLVGLFLNTAAMGAWGTLQTGKTATEVILHPLFDTLSEIISVRFSYSSRPWKRRSWGRVRIKLRLGRVVQAEPPPITRHSVSP
jgi:NAD(P)-dependent dehydrogenase (short-subunit alcohol dehydrogenase family)